jgi:uncharacterized protein
MCFNLLVMLAAVAGGGIAAVSGFGIGSLLTPTLALQIDTRLAVAAVSIPHLIGTALRFWMLGKPADAQVLWTFGVASAAGGLTGALLHARATSAWLSFILGALLLFAAISEVTNLTHRLSIQGAVAWAAGALSGLLGGLVGNQGGIRSAALLGFNLPKESFIATATAIGLIVDAARMPVYLWTHGGALSEIGLVVALAIVGVVAGTVIGTRVLVRIPAVWFRRVVAAVLAVLGAVMVGRGLDG